jgi:hypothetical protein
MILLYHIGAVIFRWMAYPFYIVGLYFAWKMMKIPISKKRFVVMGLLMAIASISGIVQRNNK